MNARRVLTLAALPFGFVAGVTLGTTAAAVTTVAYGLVAVAAYRRPTSTKDVT